MSKTVIKVENLSKQYRLGLVGSKSFKEDTIRWWAKLRGNEDPFLSQSAENDRSKFSANKFVWSLKDINFEIQQGDVLGVIGRNGAGKSTLLKILSRITAPTTGSFKSKGRIASLLEVGTGFHPELTGRENIFLNGAILGMRKNEIKRKLDEIIAFAGVERYIDTPVKRYSSGMYVRLAFAVAAHLENEILIVDEVLAVGDTEFQKKCLGKMGEISRGQGRTVLFVSHTLSSIKSLCNTALLLENGQIKFNGDVSDTISKYLSYSNKESYNSDSETIVVKSVFISNQTEQTNVLEFGDDLYVEINCFAKRKVSNPSFWLSIQSIYGPIYGANSMVDGLRPDYVEGEFKLLYKFESIKLLSQEFSIHFGVRDYDLQTPLMSSIIIGTFTIVSSFSQIGFFKTQDQFSNTSAPLLRDYTLIIDNNQEFNFKMENINLINK
jgi:lipopolysaccharide transport system ATP-binding protein